MKKLMFIVFTCALVGCGQETETRQQASLTSAALHEAGTGKCKKCGCQGWRSDSGDPERCVNIKAPSKALCQHLESEHE